MKYKAIFLRKIGEYKPNFVSVKAGKKEVKSIISNRPNFVRIGEKEFKADDEFISFKNDNSFTVQLEAYSEQNKNTLIYYYDFDSGDLIALETLLKFDIKPKDLNKITGKKIVEQIVAGAKSVQGNPLIYIIIPIVTLIVGIVLGHFLMPNTVVQTVTQPSIVTNP